ncbi:unnamed protein product, partial [Meganyctiphanes norvegica]
MTGNLPTLLTKQNVHEFFEKFDNIISDCDGVLWRDMEAIPGSASMIHKFADMGKNIFYVTNDSNSTRDHIHQKAEELGFPGQKESFLSPTYALAEYLKHRQFKRKVYVLGKPDITHELTNNQIEHCEIKEPNDDDTTCIKNLMSSINLDPSVGAVVVGFDPEINMRKLATAASYLWSDDSCLFLCMAVDENNAEMNQPIILPGVGAISKCVETACGRAPVLIGKPSRTMFDILQANHGLDPSRTLMIGDRCNSDVAFGKNCGLTTLVVLTGHTKMSLLEHYATEQDPAHKHFQPDYYVNSLKDIHELLQL